jgi:hypothetical protein
MKVFHRTNDAQEILLTGFLDSTDSYMTSENYTGVWVSDDPLDMNSGANGDILLAIEIPEELFKQYEWIEDGKPYREALIPAVELNKYGPPVIAIEDDGPLPFPPGYKPPKVRF